MHVAGEVAQIFRRARGAPPLEAKKLVRNTIVAQVIEDIFSTKPDKINTTLIKTKEKETNHIVIEKSKGYS